LPDGLAGKLCLTADELLSLFCALADPPRYGTNARRYPDQLAELDELFRLWPTHRPLRILDIGCGVGLNTLEIATHANALAPQAPLAVTGISTERLEVWMANTRQLPHDPQREKTLRNTPHDLPVAFAYGRAEDFSLPGSVDIAICNGLAGGRFLHQRAQITAFLDRCAKALTHNGRLFLANRFHDGHRDQLDDLAAIAKIQGWSCTGKTRNLCLQPPPPGR
jgi:SAM-dependent methyltransferase